MKLTEGFFGGCYDEDTVVDIFAYGFHETHNRYTKIHQSH